MLQNIRIATFWTILSICLILNNVGSRSGWVEIPQFSDDAKVYRFPSNTRDSHLNKFSISNYRTVPSYVARNISDPEEFENVEERRIEEDLEYKTSSQMKTIIAGQFDSAEAHSTSDEPGSFGDFDDEYTDGAVEVETENSDEGEQTQMESPIETSTMEVPRDEVDVISTITTVPVPTMMDVPENTSADEEYKNITQKENGFMEYLPIDMLKKVHQTLKSQPPTLKGKIRFLKQFEKSLIGEIESRLSAALAPGRKVRGASDHYEHGYDHDNDDDSIGFPSLEGALLAISFLTFAVYLVQLVMMLFRNLTTATTTTTSTLLLGRRKRSVDQLTEDTTTVLNYLDTFIAK